MEGLSSDEEHIKNAPKKRKLANDILKRPSVETGVEEDEEEESDEVEESEEEYESEEEEDIEDEEAYEVKAKAKAKTTA